MSEPSARARTPPVDRLHLGCGIITPDGWLNVDGSWNARLAKHQRLRELARRLGILTGGQAEVDWRRDVFIHDVRKPLPWAGGSFSAVYASHLLEHLYADEARRLLRECFRVLTPGGVIRIVVPDLRPMVTGYLASEPDPQGRELPADTLIEGLQLRSPSAPGPGPVVRLYAALADFQSHKWMYDAHSLAARVHEAGFHDVQERGLYESRIEGIEGIESPSRVLGGVCLEGIK